VPTPGLKPFFLPAFRWIGGLPRQTHPQKNNKGEKEEMTATGTEAMDILYQSTSQLPHILKRETLAWLHKIVIHSK